MIVAACACVAAVCLPRCIATLEVVLSRVVKQSGRSACSVLAGKPDASCSGYLEH